MGKLKKMELITINKRVIFIKIEIGVREGKVMATGSERGSSADVTLWWKNVGSGFCWIYDRTIVCQQYMSNTFINVEGCVTRAAFESFTEEGIIPEFVTHRQLTSKGWECIGDNRLNNNDLM